MADRSFPISREVHESGKRVMTAHIKIQAKGNELIPRLYFFDDTRGLTKKVHIGFIGPHYLVKHGNW